MRKMDYLEKTSLQKAWRPNWIQIWGLLPVRGVISADLHRFSFPVKTQPCSQSSGSVLSPL